MAIQRTPRNSGHLCRWRTPLRAKGHAAWRGEPGLEYAACNLPTLNGMRAPAPPPPVNRPVMAPGASVGAMPPPPMGALQAPQAGPPTDIRAILAKLFQGGGGGGGGPPLG